MTTTAEAMQAWCDLPALDGDLGWRTTIDGRGEMCHVLPEVDGIAVSATPYLDPTTAQHRFQVWVRCQCPGSGLHAFPVDSLEEAAERGLTICKRMNQPG